MTSTLKKRGPKGPSIGQATLAELMVYLKPNETVPVNNKWLNEQRAKHSEVVSIHIDNTNINSQFPETIHITKISLDDEE